MGESIFDGHHNQTLDREQREFTLVCQVCQGKNMFALSGKKHTSQNIPFLIRKRGTMDYMNNGTAARCEGHAELKQSQGAGELKRCCQGDSRRLVRKYCRYEVR